MRGRWPPPRCRPEQRLPGAFGFPKDEALRIAVDTIGEFLVENDMTVYLVIFDRKASQISAALFADIAE